MKRLSIFLVLSACACAAAMAAPPQRGAHKLGLGLDASTNDSGIPVDDSGNSAMAFTAPVVNPFTGQAVGGCHPAGFYGDFEFCVLTSTLVCGEHKVSSAAQLSPAQCAALFNLIKAGAQAQLADAGSEASFQ